MTEPDEKPQLTREQQDAEAEIALRREFTIALRACKPKERRWLRCLMDCAGLPYEAGRAAEIGKATVHRYLRLPRTNRVFKIIEALLVLDLGVNMYTQQREYKRVGYAKLSDAYYPEGHVLQGTLKKPHEWDADLAAAISEYSFDKNGDPCIKMHAKGTALDALSKLRNLGPPERLEISGPDGESLGGLIPVIQIARYSDSESAPVASLSVDAEPDQT